MSDIVSGSVDWLQRHTKDLEVRADDLHRDVQRLPGDAAWLDAARSRGWTG